MWWRGRDGDERGGGRRADATNQDKIKRQDAELHGIRETTIICVERLPVIVSFGNRATEDLYHGRRRSHVRRFPPDVVRTALRKLDVLNGAHRLDDLRAPPGNRLEMLRGNLEGLQY
jgi:plasmid maintenance system killer protein